MKMRCSSTIIAALLLTVFTPALWSISLPIAIDGNFDDWPSQPGDESIRITNDNQAVYLYFKLPQRLVFQEASGLSLKLDTDDNPVTGLNGFEIIWDAGNRSGTRYTATGSQIGDEFRYAEIGLIASPSIDSDQFELSIDRSLFSADSTRIQVEHTDSSFSREISTTLETIDFRSQRNTSEATLTDLRICSYNVLVDGLWRDPERQDFESEIRFLEPDIILFQEIYYHSASETRQWMLAVDPSFAFSAAANNSDCHIVSRFPILKGWTVAQNTAVEIQFSARQNIILISAHLPCCSSDQARKSEMAVIASFIQAIRSSEISGVAADIPIAVAGDFNLVRNDREGVDAFISAGELTPVESLHLDRNVDYTWENADDGGSYSPGRLDWVFRSDRILPLKSFVHKGQQPSDHLPVIVDFALDLDNDQMPDNWEILHFGTTDAQPESDPDNDHRTNLSEFLAGTSPQSSSDHQTVTITNTPRLLQWEGHYGAEYTIEQSPDLENWTQLDWYWRNTYGAIQLPLEAYEEAIFYRVLAQ